MTMRILVDGGPGADIAADDRGLMYGDGVFRTLRIRNGAPVWLDDHLRRLAEDCARIGLPRVPDQTWRSDIDQLSQLEADGVLKLIVTRGRGARGYRPTAEAEPTRIVMHSPLPPANQSGDTILARVCNLRLGHQPALAGIKHLNRLENVLAQAEWNDPDIAEGLLLDQDGHLVGGTKSNVFLVRDNGLVTPALSRCGVAGVTRDRVIAIATAAGIRVELNDGLWLANVMRADEVLLCNSLIGLRRIAQLEDRTWDTPVLYPLLAERLNG